MRTCQNRPILNIQELLQPREKGNLNVVIKYKENGK